MKKLHLLSCLLMVIAAMTACSESEDLTIPAPSGQFVYNGVSHELHYASRHGFYGTINSMSLLFSSADGNTRIQFSLIARWDGPGMTREDVQLVSGTYGMMEYRVQTEGDKIQAHITLSSEPYNPVWEVEYTPKGNDIYDLKIYDPEYPDTHYIEWSGKIARSNVLI